ncbi:hypothetical protein DSO57_1036716 [Entomophthora muscae]|uniref:Uncharacterized protein n=1 Tax=Entomophthora muscae TaxID=34485 RepID=A0ACC2RE44_9FUNG|nr:hypothetical protein DSO57_1036716 [Entomophthora muscae]
MYLVRGNEDPQVTVIPESLILLDLASFLPQTPPTPAAVPPQLLVIAPGHSSEAASPLALPGTTPALSGSPALFTGQPGYLC